MSTPELRQDHLLLDRDLTVIGQFLPGAPSTEPRDGTGRIAPIGRDSAELPDDATAEEIPPLFLNLDTHPFAGKTPVEEDHATVGCPRQGARAVGQPLDLDLDLGFLPGPRAGSASSCHLPG